MPNPELSSASEPATVSVVIRRIIHAPAERIFDAWTEPDHLRRWWGPAQVECVDAEVDLRIGGGYRIANQFPNGNVVWIAGEFEHVERPHKLVYTWRIGAAPESRVTVRFEPCESGTEVIILHERIADAATRDNHEEGWFGCLDGLAEYLEEGEPQIR